MRLNPQQVLFIYYLLYNAPQQVLDTKVQSWEKAVLFLLYPYNAFTRNWKLGDSSLHSSLHLAYCSSLSALLFSIASVPVYKNSESSMYAMRNLLVTILTTYLNMRASAVDVPVIGVLSQLLRDPLPEPVPPPTGGRLHSDSLNGWDPDLIDNQYVAASYVKWLESAGARAIPIHAESSAEEVEEIFKQINGVLLPGGNYNTSEVAAEKIWELARQSNDVGEHFPVFGICLGAEWMLMFESTFQKRGEVRLKKNIQFVSLSRQPQPIITILLRFMFLQDIRSCCFNSTMVSLPLEFTEYGTNGSKMFASERLREMLSEPITYNYHFLGITPDSFASDEGISTLFKMTSINHDLDGEPFVSGFESSAYPYYGVSCILSLRSYERTYHH